MKLLLNLGLFGWKATQNETVNFTIGSGVDLFSVLAPSLAKFRVSFSSTIIFIIGAA